VARGYWQGQSLGRLLWSAALAYGDREALVDGSRRIGYSELASLADLLAERLRQLGLRAGDRVVVQLPNRWELVVVTLACLRLGAPPVMALPGHRDLEITHLVRHSEAVGYVVADRFRDHDYPAMARRVADRCASLRLVVVAGDRAEAPQVDLDRLLAARPGELAPRQVETRRAELDRSDPDPRDVALFLLSGGTTGIPKLIPRSHDDYAYNARAAAAVSGLDESAVYLAALPVGHNFPLACPGVLGTLLLGGRVVMAASPDPALAFTLVERERVSIASVVPAIAQRWLEAAATTRRDLSSLRVLQVGGARLPPELARRVRPALGATLQQVFGMAEGLLCYTGLDDPEDVVCETQGQPMSPDDEVRLIDDAGRDVAPGEVGELAVQGPYTVRGYYRRPELQATCFTADGWYRSGDLVRRHPSGGLVVEGRVRDVINRGGEKISAEEVEVLARLHPAAAQAAAIAVPDPVLGERVCLFVVARPGQRVTLDELRAAMEAAGAAPFKLPERLELVESLPLTPVGKVDKKALLALAT
jgi:2,3-dihydroxybenzoate-AMP ligase